MISIGIMAYNEAENIGLLLGWLTKNRPDDEIIVVASGCTDDTVAIARLFEPQVIVMVQEKREGKASAINLFLDYAHGDILILESADTIPDGQCIGKLAAALKDGVAISGAHVIPTDDKITPANKIGHIIWEVCHNLSLNNPKLGEMICFKNVVRGIESGTSVDEALIQSLIMKWGYKSAYVPDAIVYNKTCNSMSDLISQRKRIYKGHLELKRRGYAVPSMNMLDVAIATIKAWQPYLIRAVIVEAYVRLRATIEFNRNKQEETIWERCQTTKALVKQ